MGNGLTTRPGASSVIWMNEEFDYTYDGIGIKLCLSVLLSSKKICRPPYGCISKALAHYNFSNTSVANNVN